MMKEHLVTKIVNHINFPYLYNIEMKLSVLVLSIITVISEIILAHDNTTLHLSANYKNIPLE